MACMRRSSMTADPLERRSTTAPWTRDPTHADMALLWEALQEPDGYEDALARASAIREGISPPGQVALRKTVALNEPGCPVRCNYCTLGTDIVGRWNRGEIRDAIGKEIAEARAAVPECHVELVGYWHGVRNDARLEALAEIIGESGGGYLGGDLGIIRDPQVMTALGKAGLAYVHNNLETSARLYPSAVGANGRRLEDKLATLRLAEATGLPATSGILIGVGESPADLASQVATLRNLGVQRVAVNFMDFMTSGEIADRFARCRTQLTPQYALQTLVFLRTLLREDQSLMVGSGVGTHLYGSDSFHDMLSIVDTLHVGSFINLAHGAQAKGLLGRLRAEGYAPAPPAYFSRGAAN